MTHTVFIFSLLWFSFIACKDFHFYLKRRFDASATLGRVRRPIKNSSYQKPERKLGVFVCVCVRGWSTTGDALEINRA